MSPKTPAQKISFKDIFTADYWRYFLKAAWLFFPGIIFLFLAYACFWTLTQGKDLMVITLEKDKFWVFVFFILALLFWTYVTWYTSRLVGKAKGFQQPDDHHIWVRLRIQVPRLLGFTCITVVILAFFQLPVSPVQISSPWNYVLLVLSIPVYFLIYILCEGFLNRDYDGEKYLRFLKRTGRLTFIVLILAIIIVAILHSFWALITMFVVMQAGLVLLLVLRRRISDVKNISFYQQDEKKLSFTRHSKIARRFFGLLRDEEDRPYFKWFIIFSILPVLSYIATIVSVKFSVLIGSFPFVLLAFSILLILGNFVAMVSVLARFNVHLLFWGLAFFVGLFSEPHKVNLVEKKTESRSFDIRQRLREYFLHWAKKHVPESDSSEKSTPAYFVLADGGASRSGYWVASVLSRLEDSSGGRFSKHLFCLSGASGGSVGNAAFFNLLMRKDNLEKNRQTCLDASRTYLKTDFLTYTIARMLGPDVFRYVVPLLMPLNNRAHALSRALEEAPHEKEILFNSMNAGMSEIITQQNTPAGLPILCINTTRMQDGRPGVISTIDMSEDYFNKRVDVLDLLDKKKDLKLSSAVVLGASFPYISPAGRINGADNTSQYFVDGGYFDNSGAGVVNEMIIAMKSLLDNDPEFSVYKGKVEFKVIHITNDPNPGGEPLLEKVNPLTNDLAAPIRTLAGAYGSQTSVNDSRLKNYMRSNFGAGYYTTVNLYRRNDPMSFSMNWVISERSLKGMDERLESSLALAELLKEMKEKF